MGAWSSKEVELIVADYFEMLYRELSNQDYKKSYHRKRLLPLLDQRSEGSIEFKHQNISAVLINLGQPYIQGYLPRYNYQRILEEKVIDYIHGNLTVFEDQVKKFTEEDLGQENPKMDFTKILVAPPVAGKDFREPVPAFKKNPVKVNYLELEQQNMSLGLLGEEFAMEYEKWFLINSGKRKLADQVRWVSREEGDGLGYDILSRNMDGTDKYIEVKTTRLGKETPFFYSRNELLFSIDNELNYSLYRIFSFKSGPKLFTKMGRLDRIASMNIPVSYKAYF